MPVIGYYGNTTAYLLQNIKTKHISVCGNVKFNKNNLPGFHNEIKDIEGSFIYLD